MLWCLALATPLALLHAERSGRRRDWILAGALAAAAVLTHAYGVLALVPLLLWPLLNPRPPDPRPTSSRLTRGYLLAALTATLLYAPWLPRALGILGHQGWREGWPLAGAAWANLGAWSTGTRADWSPGPPSRSQLGSAVYLGLALVGLITLVRSAIAHRGAEGPRAPHRALRSIPFQPPTAPHALRALALGLLPPLAYALILAATSHPGAGGQRLADYDPRYFMAGLGGFYLLAAVGGSTLGGRCSLSACVLLIAAAVMPLRGLYSDPRFQKPDYRALMTRVALTARDPSTQPVLYPSTHDEDTVLLLDGPSEGLARRYRTDGMPVKIVRLPDGEDAAARDETLERLDALAGEYATLWLVEDGQARGWAADWLNARACPVTDEAMRDWRLRRFLMAAHDATLPSDLMASARDLSGPTAGWTPLARSPDGVLVLSNLVSPRAVEDGTPPTRGVAGQVLYLRLGWAAPAGSTLPERLSLRLLRPTAPPGAPAVTSVDRPVLPWWPGRTVPSTTERPAPPWLDRQGLALPEDLPPGDYVLELRAYDGASVDRLVTTMALVVGEHLPDRLPPPPISGSVP
ncbi:MAG: hypothetical protein IPJ58_10300 [Ardenticatenia bacterium]|nr:hypothetical protein [Ardenticatenia bacterium]